MTLIRTSERERLTAATKPGGCPAHSAGRFRLTADGTSQFDRHYHDFDEFWFVAAGYAAIAVGDTTYQAQPGDIIYTPAGTIHDITAITGREDLEVFWLSWTLPGGASGQHLHQDPADAAKHPVPAQPGAQT
jgi:mannose-6-phosphate isomerase-like protein (cupin superfamily)